MLEILRKTLMNTKEHYMIYILYIYFNELLRINEISKQPKIMTDVFIIFVERIPRKPIERIAN